MIAALEAAVSQCADPLDVPMLSVMPQIPAADRKRGRPRKEIDKQFLAGALTLRGPTGIARSLNCNPRTVRRRALDYGLADPGAPCYQDIPQADGTTRRVWQSTGPPIAAISDMPAELDREIADILCLFPTFGRSMLAGALRSRGFRVPQDRIEASYLRVHGAPPRLFGERRLERKKYSVPGVNSLWHHDGQHSRCFPALRPRLTSDIMFPRSDTMETGHSFLHRRQVPLLDRNSNQQQQSGDHSACCL
jgi:hypothetical protein